MYAYFGGNCFMKSAPGEVLQRQVAGPAVGEHQGVQNLHVVQELGVGGSWNRKQLEIK
jgi:hypothetical protein